AEKAQDTGGSTYISYLIHTEIPEFNIDIETRHRYSEFEAFQKYIIRAYPTCVIPPIPDKHTISDYATKQAKAKEDPNTIEKRKRMLQTFLNRVATHPLLSRDVVFHKFLEPGIAWHEALTNATIPTSTINRNKSALQKLTEVKSLRNPGFLYLTISLLFTNIKHAKDPQFTAAEDYTTRFSIQTNQALIVQRHLVKLEQESAQTYSELGAIFNAWSLSEKEISQAVENTGQAFDSMATVTTQLAHAMEERMTEPLQEYMFYSKGIERLLSWRHDRHVEFEVVTETIHSKKSSLQKLEASELEAQRLAAALRAEGTLGYRQHLPPPSISGAMSGDPSGVDGNSILAQSEYHPPAITPRPQGILATLNSLIDNDPEMTRRSTISKTKDRLTTLAEQRVAALQDLQAANLEIQTDLDRFQNGKIADFRNFFLSYALAMREYHRRSIDAWEDAKLHIEKVNH
ncbi:Sorting nexin, cytoplasm-to-vacuole targeting pathway/endosomal sorting, partial [Nowakowskiella sp. JEL0078]